MTLFVIVLLLLSHLVITAQPVIRILPLGNSITYDENSLDVSNPRPVGDRISYRYKLYQLMNSAGYAFDFVGSENSGNNYFQNTEMDDNAGFPGIDKAQMANLISTGINGVNGAHVSPGPYLQYYPADIILLHIGTNNLTESSSEVSDILDNIRAEESQVFILVARIINREDNNSPQTTTFNNNVEAMVNARGDPRIRMVNMETGAGINYSTEMVDNLHPKQSGFDKMAVKWFEAIDNLNSPPVISNIPTQFTLEGSAFQNVSLDGFVMDTEDPANMINWTFIQEADSHLLVSIDENRILHVTPADDDWNGTEIISLKAGDTGSGTYKKSATYEATFTVQPANDPPVITSTPIGSTFEDSEYNYTVTATDIEVGDTLTYSAPSIPEWLSFDPSTHILSGIPINDNVGITSITVRVSDGTVDVDQTFQLTVINVNDIPVITSTPILTVHANETYLYEFTASDVDVGDTLNYTADKPDWLAFSSGSTSGILAGTPTQTDIGSYSIILAVSDGLSDIFQEFTLTVNGPSNINDHGSSLIQDVYPNPSTDLIYFKYGSSGKCRVEIYDMTGNLLTKDDSENSDLVEINIAGLPKGTYIYKAYQHDEISVGKITRK